MCFAAADARNFHFLANPSSSLAKKTFNKLELSPGWTLAGAYDVRKLFRFLPRRRVAQFDASLTFQPVPWKPFSSFIEDVRYAFRLNTTNPRDADAIAYHKIASVPS